MGQILSRLLYSTEHIQQIFSIMYMSANGPTEFNMELTPDITTDDSQEMVNQKLKNALKKQNALKRMYKSTSEKLEGGPSRSKSFVNGFSQYFSSINAIPNAFKDSMLMRKNSVDQNSQFRHMTNNRTQEDFNFPNRELRERRARSRPEPSVMPVLNSRRQAKSVSMHETLTTIEENLFESVEVEMIDVETTKDSPLTDTQKTTSDLKEIRPTTHFLASFRSNSSTTCHEAEYSFDRAKGIDSFKFTGSLESLLSGDAKLSYEKDKRNNNLDEKAIFFNNMPDLFNSMEGQILINGYILPLDKNEGRFKLLSLKLDTPSMSFDMSGLKHVKASKNGAELFLHGLKEDDEIVKSISIRGKSEQDVKELLIQREKMMVKVQFPLLSRIPVSNKK